MIGLALMSLLAASPEPVPSLPGVSDIETSIAFATPGSIREVHRGHGDVLFVRARTNQWYRVQLNEGCLRNFNGSVHDFGVDAGMNRRLEAHDRVVLDRTRSCLVDSIRESAAPPQVDSNSILTLE